MNANANDRQRAETIIKHQRQRRRERNGQFELNIRAQNKMVWLEMVDKEGSRGIQSNPTHPIAHRIPHFMYRMHHCDSINPIHTTHALQSFVVHHPLLISSHRKPNKTRNPGSKPIQSIPSHKCTQPEKRGRGEIERDTNQLVSVLASPRSFQEARSSGSEILKDILK